MHLADNYGSLVMKCIDIRELHLHDVLIRSRKAWVVNNKDFCFFSFFSIITILYRIESDLWLNTKGLIPGRRLARRLFWWSLYRSFLTDGLGHGQKWDIFIQHKSIINQTSVSNTTVPHLRESWMQSTSASVLYILLDNTEVVELCCLEALN